MLLNEIVNSNCRGVGGYNSMRRESNFVDVDNKIGTRAINRDDDIGMKVSSEALQIRSSRRVSDLGHSSAARCTLFSDIPRSPREPFAIAVCLATSLCVNNSYDISSHTFVRVHAHR